MFEMTQAQIARAVDVLRSGPVKADVFATRMWPDKKFDKGNAGRAGHSILRRLGALGYVERVGDLWMTRAFSQSLPVVSREETRVALGAGPGEPLRESLREHPSVPLSEPLREGQREEQEARQRLQQLVGLADELVPTVTHDRTFGDLRIRGRAVDDCLAEACAFAVLRGRSINVYLPVGEMLVALTPIEGGRALHVRWRQSGIPPEPPFRGGVLWINVEDGIASAPNCWQPEGADRYWTEEPTLQRIARQRAEAGLGR